MNFADRLADAVAERRSQLALGLDPDATRLLPQALASAGQGSAAERAARAVTEHCRMLIDAAATACVAAKLQLACFERLGSPGWQALGDVSAAAREAGLLVIADGKRGDVPHTAAAYGQALTGETPTPWGSVPGLGADAVTANPLLGDDALRPIVDAARAVGAGTFVLVRTSNPGAAALQGAGPGGPPLYERLAALVHELGKEAIGRSGLSDVGAVVAATEPGPIAALRALMPHAVFLMPGVGAQGGRVELLGAAFSAGPSSALVAASRSIADEALEAGDPAAALAAAERLRAATWEVSSNG